MSKFSVFIARFIPLVLEKQIRSFRDKKLRKLKVTKLPEKIYAPGLTYHKISLCITCMNRLYQLKYTLLQNIMDNMDYPNLEICLLNYNSSDGLDEFIRENFRQYIDQGILRYLYTKEPESFHSSKAKNFAHYFATGDIVCNLDGDNFTGKDFAFYLNYVYNTYGDDHVFHFKKEPFWGTMGRIAMARKEFLRLGGYDEEFYPTAHQDNDIIERAKRIGLKYHIVGIENFLRYISNSRAEKIQNLKEKGRPWQYYDKENRKISARKYKAGIFIANQDVDKLIDIQVNFEDKRLQFKPHQT